MLRLRQRDYFEAHEEMHYAQIQTAERIAPTLHTHEFFEIFLLTGGEIDHLINGHRLTLVDGSMTFIRPEDIHCCRPVRNRGCQVINLAIARPAINDLFTFLGEGFRAERILNLKLPPTVKLDQSAKRHIMTQLEQLNAIPREQTAEKRTALRMLLFELVTQYFPLALRKNRSNMPSWLQHAIEEMRKPENLAAGLPRMLTLAAVSPEHLARTVRKFLQQTPTDYVNQLRLNYAANLLSHGDLDILTIASEVGFESLSYFYALFKAQYGQTPRQFRHSHQPKLMD